MNQTQTAGLSELERLATLLTQRFGEAGKSAILAGLKRDIVRQGLDGKAAVIYVQATRILYESAEPLHQEVRQCVTSMYQY